MSPAVRIPLLLRSLRHVGLRQVVTRAVISFRRQVWRRAPELAVRTAARMCNKDLGDLCEFNTVLGLRQVLNQSGGGIEPHPTGHSVTLLGYSQVVMPGQINWQYRRNGLLWLYHLHYFDYAVPLGATSATDRAHAYRQFVELAESWISSNPPGSAPGWWPYPLSLRLFNWLVATRTFSEELKADERFRGLLVRSLKTQAWFLAGSLEYDVRGNHLIKNLKALYAAGRALRVDRWCHRAVRGLWQELRHQILADGCHYERSPAYHAQVLQDLLEWRPLLGPAEQERLTDEIRRMGKFLRGITHPDGDVPFFNDGCLLTPNVVQALCAAAGVRALVRGDRAYADAGYFVLEDGPVYAVIDCGQPCPTSLPAHAHCDALSYELSYGGRRVAVNRGTFTYAGPERGTFRGTAAHNTVHVGNVEQSEIWGNFRLGRRAEVLGARFEPGEFRGTIRAGGTRPYTHSRTVVRGPSFLLIYDTINGAGALPVMARVHLHPEVGVTTTMNLAELQTAEARLWVCADRPLTLADSSWSPRMHHTEPCREIRFDQQTVGGQARTVHLWSWDEPPAELCLTGSVEAAMIEFNLGRSTWSVALGQKVTTCISH